MQYAKYVEQYSGRQLTVTGDRLIAFEGIAQFLSAQLVWEIPAKSPAFRFGLPTWYFDWALLWETKDPGTIDGKVTRISSKSKFPSWS
jgi:hypothetical protein